MGSGKGSPELWVARVKPGRIIFELDGVTDPEGVYTARVTIWDQIRGEATKAEFQFTVTR